MQKLSNNWILLSALSFAIVLRIFSFGQIPPSLNWDEISHGYNAYSVLATGKDEWGVSWPTIFRAYGDYKLPVYIYLTAISEAIFGLNEFSIRFVSVLAGLGIIIFSYLLASKLWGKNVGLITSFLVAIEPWSLFLSRGAFEANLGQFFVISGVYFYLTGLGKPRWLIASALLFGLSVWTYNSERIFVPLFLIFLLFVFKDKINMIWKKNYFVLASLILLLFFVPMFSQLIKQEGQARYSNVALIDQGAISYIEQAQSNEPLSRLYINKYTYFGYHFLANWVSHFSPGFLFFTGGSQYQFNIPNRGLLYMINIPFIILGLIFLLKNKSRQMWVILGWVFLAPLASSLTREAPHTLRSVTMLPIPMILSALGIYWLTTSIKIKELKMTVKVLVAILFIISTHFYLQKYFIFYSKDYSQVWQYGYKEAVEYSKVHYSEYDQIIVTKKYGEPHEFFLFYWPWDSKNYNEDKNLVRYGQSNWYWVDSFDKFIFVNDWDIPKDKREDWKTERKTPIDVSRKTLLITSPSTYPKGWKKLETINFLDGKPAFDILEN